jgi:hypothetical protein
VYKFFGPGSSSLEIAESVCADTAAMRRSHRGGWQVLQQTLRFVSSDKTSEVTREDV